MTFVYPHVSTDAIIDGATVGKRKVASQEIHDLEGLRKLYANVSLCVRALIELR